MKLLTTKQVCEILSVTNRTLYDWRKDDKKNFPEPVFLGGGNRYKEDEIEAFVESQYANVA